MWGIGIRQLVCVGALLLLMACDSVEERAAKHHARGLDLLVAGETAKARLEFRNALRLDATLVPAHLAMAELSERAGQLHAAVRHLGEAVDHEPTNVEARRRLARHLATLGDYEAVLRHGTTIAEQRPDEAAGYALRAVAHLNLDDLEAAAKDADAALARAPGHAAALMVRAEVLAATEREDAAADILITALPSASETARFHHRRVHLLQQLGRFEDLVGITQQLTERFPEDVYLWQQHVNHLVLTGQMEAAEAALRQMLDAQIGGEETRSAHLRFVAGVRGEEAARAELRAEVDRLPKRWDLRLELADFDQRTGRVAEAEEALATIAATAPGEGVRNAARVRLGRLALGRRDFIEAMALSETVLATDPSEFQALAIRAAVLEVAGETDQALDAVREALNETVDEVDLILLHARLLEREGRPLLATDEVNRALRLTGGRPDIALRYASLSLRQSGRPRAIRALEDALVQHPAHPRLLLALGLHHLANGDPDELSDIASRLDGIDTRYGQSMRAVGALHRGQPAEAALLLEDVVAAEGAPPVISVLLFGVRMDLDAPATAVGGVADLGAEFKEKALAPLLSAAAMAEAGATAEVARVLEAEFGEGPGDSALALGAARLLAEVSAPDVATALIDSAMRHAHLNQALWLAGIAEAPAAEHGSDERETDGSVSSREPVAENTAHAFWSDLAHPPPGVSLGAFIDRYRWLLEATLTMNNPPLALSPPTEAISSSAWAQYRMGEALMKIGLFERGRSHLEAALSLTENQPFEPRADVEALLQSTL
ncbi:MAG: tetratricopeptide repeat protein [Pseudomonadota bacterium]